MISAGTVRSEASASVRNCRYRSSGKRRRYTALRSFSAILNLPQISCALLNVDACVPPACGLRTEIKMGHGGKRAGAGRPRKIEEEFDRWHLGCLCEHEQRMIARGAAMERIEE